MGLSLGIDLGTTKVAVVVIDADTGEQVAVRTADNVTRLQSAPGRSEWDAEAAYTLALRTAGLSLAEVDAPRVVGLGVTGQMHGSVLVGRGGRPLGPFIGWQDQRCEEPMDGHASAIAWMHELAGEGGFARTGCWLATGYAGATLFWLRRRDDIPADAIAAFLPDFVVSRLCEQPPVTDPTNAGSSGVFDVTRHHWDSCLLGALDLTEDQLPVVQPTGAVVGRLGPAAAGALGLPAGLPVMNALGDNQASFIGSVADFAADVLVNVGTGGQISLASRRFVPAGAIETRCLLGDWNLLVGAELSGGSAYALLREFYVRVGRECLGSDAAGDVYQAMEAAAAEIPAGADGLRFDPRFLGTRLEPDRRGVATGLSAANFTPGHLARALLEGSAESYWALYGEMLEAGADGRQRIVGSGNGIRRNRLFRRILSERFGLPLVMPAHQEEAAYGAALLAGVAVGATASLEQASRRIAYQPASRAFL